VVGAFPLFIKTLVGRGNALICLTLAQCRQAFYIVIMSEISDGIPQSVEIEPKKANRNKASQKEIMLVNGQTVVVRDGVDKETFLPALESALTIVPENIRKGVIVYMYADYPDNQAKSYEGGGDGTSPQD